MPRAKFWSLILLIAVVALPVWAQENSRISDAPGPEDPRADEKSVGYGDGYELPPGEDPNNRLGVPLVRHLVGDQKTFWTSPIRLQRKDLPLLLPFAAVTGSLIAADSWLARQVPDRASQLKQSRNISKYAAFSLVGVAGGSFLLGQIKGNDHLREAGFLSGEAAVNATAVDYALKTVFQRPRPFEGNGNGNFFQGGASFPSEHSALAWSIASVFAHEYPGPLSKLFAYGLASAVTLTRVTSKQHFPADAFLGSALGWYLGRQIYRAHHDPELGGEPWGDFPEAREPGPRNPENMGSPTVPVDSWVYSAFERLVALGYVQGGYEGLRPWTRMECARLIESAAERLRLRSDSETEGHKLYAALASEFADETRRLDGAANIGISLDSIYTRMTGISGTPLHDGYHFGQTIINDYGRPYGEGFNNVSGVTSHAVLGPFSLFIQGEYQHSPAVPSDATSVLAATASADHTRPLANGVPEINRFRLLNGSVALTYKNVQISFGKQDLWWGPGDGGPFLFSDNAESIPMVRIDQTTPLHVPGVSRILGPMRSQFFLGQLTGQRWVFSDNTLYGPDVARQPFIHGEKVQFKPTPNFEIGFGVSVLFGGPNVSFTWSNFLKTFTSSGLASNGLPGTPQDPGDRRATADFSYRLPHLRDWITIYADSFVEDEISPVGSSRPSLRPGIYFPKIPKLPKLDLRVEAVYTDAPNTVFLGNVYANGRFVSGYTNNGFLLGSWIGRAGKGGQAAATYWFSPQNKLQVFYRRQVVSGQFIGGGGLHDAGFTGEFAIRPDLTFKTVVQYERWSFPVLASGVHTNLSASTTLTYWPKWKKGR